MVLFCDVCHGWACELQEREFSHSMDRFMIMRRGVELGPL